MKIFKILIVETLEHLINKKADTLTEAIEKVTEMYNNSKIVLTYENHTDTTITEYEN